MENNDFSFLSSRITEPSLETDYFLLNVNSVFVKSPVGDDLKRDRLLLKFTQRIWEIPPNVDPGILTPFYGYYTSQEKDETGFHVHDIIYQDFLKPKLQLTGAISCQPTLSFRTLMYDSQTHIKFGLPLKYGSVVRRNTKREVLTALYFSDYIRQLPKMEHLDFFLEYKGYSLIGLENFSVSYRKWEGGTTTMPFSCYFNQMLHYSESSPKDRLIKTLDFLSNFLHNFNAIYAVLDSAGLGLEIHGQNLLVQLDTNNHFSGKYLYRDLGTCTLDPHIQKEQSALNRYYQSNYHFTFPEGQLIHPGHYAWKNYRIFFMGFLLYNLDSFVRTAHIDLNVYQWFENTTKDLDWINRIY